MPHALQARPAVRPLRTELGHTCSTFGQLLAHRASHTPHQIAIGFIDKADGAVDRLDYATLFEQACALAARLQQLCQPGGRALLVIRNNRLFVSAFLACLLAGVVAVPAPCPRREQLNQRLRGLARDSGASLLLCDTDEVLRFDMNAEGATRVYSLDLRQPVTTSSALWTPPAPQAQGIAFLQYTSGSTGAPRGVMVSHGNLWANCAAIESALGFSAQSVQLTALPLFHDMGLIVGILQPLYTGCPAYLMPPQLFAASPLLWLQSIARLGVTISGGPNFMYDHTVESVHDDEVCGLDLSSWRVAFSGAEPVKVATLQRFAQKFAPAGFRATALQPCYGMAEATLFATGHALDTEPRVQRLRDDRQVERAVVSCGAPAAGHRVAVVDPRTREACADETEGEIWLAGPSVTQGYWGQPELTERTYGGQIAGQEQAGAFLRTGDLGFLREGALYVTGRLKDLIIVRGRNFAPHDLEQAAEAAHPSLRASASAAFMARGDDDSERVVLALELKRTALHQPHTWPDIRAAVRRAILANFELNLDDVVLLRTASIPKTSSGKLQRSACAAGYLDESLAALRDPEPLPVKNTPRWIDLSWMRAELAKVSKRPVHSIDPEASLLDQGIDSLAAVVFACGLSKRLEAEVDPSVLFDCGSLERIHHWVHSTLQAPPAAQASPTPI